MNGLLDNNTIYNTNGLFDNNLLYNINNSEYVNPDIIKDGLLLQYDFYNKKCATGGVDYINDLSQYKNNSIVYNGVRYQNDYKGLMYFDGTDDKIQDDNFNGFISNPSYTLCSLFKPFTVILSNGADRAIIWYGANTEGVTRGVISLDQKGTGTGSRICSLHYGDDVTFTQVNLVQNTIYYAVITYDNTTRNASLYLNGTFVQTLQHTGDLNVTSKYLFIGGGMRYFNGNIYNTHIYNRVLTASEILKNYQVIKTINRV